MKRIRREDIPLSGIYVDLEISYIPYEKLIYHPEKYLDKNKTYYFHCKGGIKSKEVVMSLEQKGYNVYQVI